MQTGVGLLQGFLNRGESKGTVSVSRVTRLLFLYWIAWYRIPRHRVPVKLGAGKFTVHLDAPLSGPPHHLAASLILGVPWVGSTAPAVHT